VDQLQFKYEEDDQAIYDVNEENEKYYLRNKDFLQQFTGFRKKELDIIQRTNDL